MKWPNILLAIALALAAHMPWAQSLLEIEDQGDTFAWLITVGCLLYGITSTILISDSKEARQELERVASELRRQKNAPTIQPLSDYEFYRTFLTAAEQAEHSVWIAYLDPSRPDAAGRPDRDRYYRNLLAAMRENHHAQFRRLIRDTQSNREWLLERMPDLATCPNVSVALLADLPEEKVMPRSLSVQIIDGRSCWLVAVKAHERQGQPHRDLWVDDPTVSEFLGLYYERLWDQAVVVLRDGQLTAEGYEMQRHAERDR